MVRSQGSCVAIRALSPSSSIPRCAGHDHASSDDATCGTPTWIGKGLTCVCFKRKGHYERICINLTPQQASHFYITSNLQWHFSHFEERLKRLKHRMKVYFDASRPDHQEALRALWYATYPNRELHGLISDQWKEMGWQGRDPSTDFRYIFLYVLLGQRSWIHFLGEPVVLCKNIFDIFSASTEKTGRRTSCLGISICCCWFKYNIYDHANARPRCLKTQDFRQISFLANVVRK
ncbi:uncharacterized protein LOC107433989 isoform X7 [Ziziphus jujuba]|uniref:Uncharacterized protein LOC107433989 isoform X7 n=1 Tax=Ziziphus jujuba TaxID=326968 RepID=A0ABM3ZXM3_ZIZJJ|nr:uncharacterized protein LOC107433989 isoform X7 [Ziziphus jujuba]